MRARNSERMVCSLAIFNLQGVAGRDRNGLAIVGKAFHVVLHIPGKFGVHREPSTSSQIRHRVRYDRHIKDICFRG